MFDTVRTKCPACGTELSEQSKAGACLLNEYSLGDVPAPIAADIAGRRIDCPCGAAWVVNGQRDDARKLGACLMSEHQARLMREARMRREFDTAVTERAGYLAVVAALIRYDDLGSAIDTAAMILDMARTRAERDIVRQAEQDAQAAGGK